MTHGILLKTHQLDYQDAWNLQKRLHQDLVRGTGTDTLILTEHPHTYTIGKSGQESNLVTDEKRLNESGIQVYRIDRGGDITYHGPGQIVGYPILDLHNYYLDVHRFLRDLEEVIIRTLAEYDISAGRVEGLTGVWVAEEKIAAIGVKVSRWVTMHGFALNVSTNLTYFGHIVPCGIVDKPVTSMHKLLSRQPSFIEVRSKIAENFSQVFGIDFREARIEDFLNTEASLPASVGIPDSIS
ncbi:MAG: lipoyl(octanoyl) transferase LipB [bacterium]